MRLSRPRAQPAPAPSSGGAWSALSDAHSKEHFRDLAGDDVLAKIARMPIREWNYKAQDAGIRHVGPTAQDFHAAFGLGEDPLRISTIDADGIALRAIQALEARTRADRDALARENAELRSAVAGLQARLAALEAPRLNGIVFTDYARCGPAWYVRQTRHMVSYQIEDRVAMLAVPLLVLRGGTDPIARQSWAQRLAARAGDGEVAVIPGHRHLAQFTAPAASAERIRAFTAAKVSSRLS